MNIDFNSMKHIYFIGIGGISMSGLAEILLKRGLKVSGSDANDSELIKRLMGDGIQVNIGQYAENITEDIDLIVYTAAISAENPELIRAKELGIPCISRASLLGFLMDSYKEAIAISGTHGKTSTTSMLSHILMYADTDPTISVGGILPLIGGNIRIGGEDIFLTEACEYTNSFLELNPSIEVILNVEEDHLDFFTDIEDIRNSFKAFVQRLRKGGTVIINEKIDRWEELVGAEARRITIGTDKADILAKNPVTDHEGNISFDVFAFGEELGRVALHIGGEHNMENALAAIAAAYALGIDVEDMKQGLGTYHGVKRRFEKKGELGNIEIIDDYAHHPSEIEACLKLARTYGKRVICIFQPHTYTRTKAFLQEFADSLALADTVILAKIYPARETDTLGVSSDDIAKLLKVKGKEVYYIESFDDIETFLLENLKEGDMCITMGAGDIVKVGEKLLGQ